MKSGIYILTIVALLASVASAAKPPNFVVVYVDNLGWAETVTLTRRNYVELLEGGWIENGRERLAKLKVELAADPDNK